MKLYLITLPLVVPLVYVVASACWRDQTNREAGRTVVRSLCLLLVALALFSLHSSVDNTRQESTNLAYEGGKRHAVP